MPRPLLSALLVYTPLLVAATNFGDHIFYPYEKCLNTFYGGDDWAHNACIDSECRVPVDPASADNMYCIPTDVRIGACASIMSNTAPYNVTEYGGECACHIVCTVIPIVVPI